jgi:hypothetical protein
MGHDFILLLDAYLERQCQVQEKADKFRFEL